MIGAKGRWVDERDLYETIANLSYEGDIRHAFGAEDTQKASKIVSGSFSKMRERVVRGEFSRFSRLVGRD